MKYKRKKEEILEDNELFNRFSNLHKLSRDTGINVSFLCNVRNGKRIITESAYLKLKDILNSVDKS